MIESESTGVVVGVRDAGPRAVRLCFSEPTRPFPEIENDLMLDFCVRARGEWVSVEVSVRTWAGDGLDSFLDELAEDFRGWEGARTWRSLEHDLTLSATHDPRGYVHLTWGLHDRPPSEEWHFETTTVHAAGEDMRNLATEIRAFLVTDS
ncbi:DUF6228 family protein [Streptomyces bambusae]|uniref:Permease n=1 Tax=Streptomyces bambusae TaxID=1550616 RepID=A0ABS6Z6S9_9ACTN|nr:DUF6228 family protein [Streptomyces bambusae]MBW5483452.1 hypothetical protein [Streptomyces bambusae]